MSPERIDPGRKDWLVHNSPKVIGGMTPDCLERAQALYESAIETIVPEASRMPLYRIFNDPFTYLLELSGGQAENIKNVKGIKGMAEFLTTEEAAA